MMSDDSRREIIPRARPHPRHRDSAFIMGISLITSNSSPSGPSINDVSTEV